MSTQMYLCVLCNENFDTVYDYGQHEKGKNHRVKFEKRMDEISTGLLLCKCCFVVMPDLKSWTVHTRSRDHVKMVAQSDFMGKKCVWDVPGVKMGDGSIKLCKTMNALWATGWTDPEKSRKLGKKLETDSIIGMNCIQLNYIDGDYPVYYCTLCDIEFHHNNRDHVLSQNHRINVIWNWEGSTADRIARGLDYPKMTTKVKAKNELMEVTQRVFEKEQQHLNEEQYNLYLVMIGQKNVTEIHPLPEPASAPPSSKTTSTSVPAASKSSSSSDKPEGSFNVEGIEIHPDVRAMMLKLRGNLVPDTSVSKQQEEPSKDMIEKINTLTVLTQSLLNYQTNVRVVPMELPRTQLQNAINDINALEETLGKLVSST